MTQLLSDIAKAKGAGFAGFAAWLDMTPADPDILADAPLRCHFRNL
jgi:hypothetical protein